MPYVSGKDEQPGYLIGLGTNPDIISKAQQSQINCLKKGLVKKATPAECVFREQIAAKLIRRMMSGRCHRCKTRSSEFRYIFQKEFLVATGITFIVDFYFPKMKLVVEIDGKQHHSELGIAKDKWRADLLHRELGISTIHFDNDEVLKETHLVWCRLINFMVENVGGNRSCRNRLLQFRDQNKLPFTWPKKQMTMIKSGLSDLESKNVSFPAGPLE